MRYIAYDPTGYVKMQVSDYSDEMLDRMERNGYTFYEVDDDGVEHSITRADVVKPDIQQTSQQMPFITYQQWQDTMEPLRALMAETMQPATALMPLSIRAGINFNYQQFITALDRVDDSFNQEAS